MQNFQAGDFLIFQIESGYGLMKILAIDEAEDGKIWHLRSFNELFPDVEFADQALQHPENLTVSNPHFAITQRAFESTQVARMGNFSLSQEELNTVLDWRNVTHPEISDRSARLIMGLR